MCIPPMELMSQNKCMNPPTAYKANSQLEGLVQEGDSTKDNRMGNATTFPGWGLGDLGGHAFGGQPRTKQ